MYKKEKEKSIKKVKTYFSFFLLYIFQLKEVGQNLSLHKNSIVKVVVCDHA